MAQARNRSVYFALPIIFTIIGLALLACWVGTQYFAAAAGYQVGLGTPLIRFASGRKLYPPFAWLPWSIQWFNATGLLKATIDRMLYLVAGGLLAAFVTGFVLYYRRSLKMALPEDLHGSARFATLADVEKMGLIAADRPGAGGQRQRYRPMGVYVGAFETPQGRKVLRYNEAAHLFCYAPSRSGKGVGVVLPTLLSYPNSVAVNDIKGENFELTSGFRHQAGTLVIRFDPTAVDDKSLDGVTRNCATARWNPLNEIRIFTEYDVMDAQNLAAAIADPDAKGMEDHWVSTSYELFVGLFLHLLYAEHNKSLSGAAFYLADPSFSDPQQMFERMLNSEHDPGGRMGWVDSMGQPTNTHPVVAAAARAMLNKEEKERNSVLSTAKTKLGLFVEPIVARNTAQSDFMLRDLMHHDKPVSFYLVVPPSDKERLRPLLRLFITFMLRTLAKDMKFEDGASVKNYKHRLLLLIDELPSLKKLEQLQDGLGYLAGYGITAFLFVQDRKQLTDIYGDKETISAGCQLQIAFAPNELDTAEEISGKLGKETRRRQNVSYSGNRMGPMLGQMSVSEDLIERPLLTPDEVRALPRDECLIFNTGHPPIRGKKLFYYKMPAFAARAKLAPPARISLHYLQDGQLVGQWFMAQVTMAADRTLQLVLHCYADYPPVRVVVKQEDGASGALLTFDYTLCRPDGTPFTGPLGLDDTAFIARPAGEVTRLDPQEAFEVHFPVREPAALAHCSEAGFFQEASVYERDARRLVNEHFYAREAQDGRPYDLIIDRVVAAGRYRGTVQLETGQFIVLLKDGTEDFVTLHRKMKLDRVPRLGERVLIRYTGQQGLVTPL